MTFWEKLLIIVVFVLSIAFAGMSAVIFAKRQNFKAKWDLEVKAHRNTTAQKDKEINKLKSDCAALTTQVTQKTNTAQTLKSRLVEVESNLRTANSEKATLAKDLEDRKEEVKNLVQKNADYAAMNQTLVKENDNFRGQVAAKVAELSAERTRVNTLENQKRELQDGLDGLKVKHAKAEEKIAETDRVLAELARRGIPVLPILRGERATPMVRGKVAKVDENTQTVILNVGKNQNVQTNFEFTVFRGGTYVAKVAVFDLRPNMSAARVVQKKQPIQVGDDAWTRLR